MFTIVVDFELKKKIELKKIGVTFRKLSIKEKERILKYIDDFFYKKKNSILNFLNNYNFDEEYKLCHDLFECDDITRESVLMCFYAMKAGFNINSKKSIIEILNRSIVITYNTDVLCDFVEEKQIEKVISNLLSLYDIYNDSIEINMKVRNDYSYILKTNILDYGDKCYNQNLLTDIIFSYGKEKKLKKEVCLSEKYLLDLNIFFNSLSKEELRRFFLCLDLLYSSTNMIQSSILNKVTIIESILIGEGEMIEYNFILKAGMILKQYLNFRNRRVNQFIKESLEYSYKVRSAIVHGNEGKIIEIYNKLKQQKRNPLSELLKNESEHYIEKKNEALYVSEALLLLVVRSVFKYWIEYPQHVNYLKGQY